MSLIGDTMKKIHDIHTMEFYVAIERNEEPYTGLQRDLRIEGKMQNSMHLRKRNVAAHSKEKNR